MKRIVITALTAGILSVGANAQVEFKKPVSSKSFGTSKILAKAPKKVLINQFSLFFKTTGWVAKGDAVNGVGIAAYLNLDEALAQEITNDALEYAKQQLKASGYEVITYDAEKVKSSKVYQKESGKGKATLTNGGAVADVPKRPSKGDASLTVSAQGVNSVKFSNANLMIPIKFDQEYFGKEEMLKLNFTTGFGFIQSSAYSTSTSNNVKVVPLLDCGNYAGIPAIEYRDVKLKYAGIHFNSHKLKYNGTNWIGGKEEKEELYGSSVRYELNKEEYKKACMEMLKVYIDQMIAALQEECAPKK